VLQQSAATGRSFINMYEPNSVSIVECKCILPGWWWWSCPLTQYNMHTYPTKPLFTHLHTAFASFIHMRFHCSLIMICNVLSPVRTFLLPWGTMCVSKDVCLI
jgi:hypothetical protein